jgi:hypothetical protein
LHLDQEVIKLEKESNSKHRKARALADWLRSEGLTNNDIAINITG